MYVATSDYVKQPYKEYLKLNKNILLGFSARWFLQYYLLTKDYTAYLASLMAQSLSTVIYIAVVNLSLKFMRLYKDGS